MSDWRPGEPITSRKLNAHSASRAQVDVSGPAGSFSKFGQHWASTQADLTNTGMWVRVTSDPVVTSAVVTGAITQNVSLHSWEAIYWNDGLKKWQSNPASYGNASVSGNKTSDYDAIIASNLGNLTRTQDANLTANGVVQSGVTPYFAVRDPVSRRLIAVDTDSRSTFRGKDVLLMILGPYQNFTSCPNAPSLPPVASDANCPTAYAWSGYKVCGYNMKKVATYQTSSTPGVVGMGFWATGLNGETTSAWRRFHRAWWGWDTEDSLVLDPEVLCGGVRFENPSVGALNCTCPPWLSAVECFRVRVKYVSDPGPPSGETCAACYAKMSGFWGTEQTAILCNNEMGCVWQSNEGPAPMGSATATHQAIYEIDPCFTGPDEFDPCDPCDGFSTLSISINDASSPSGCGGPGNLYVGGRVSSLSALKAFVDACANGENPPALTLTNITKSGVCPNYIEWIKLECCSCEESNAECGTTLDCGIIDGGNPGSLPTDSVDGGSPGSLPTDTIDGGVI